MTQSIEIKKYRGKFAIFAGKSRLASGFATAEKAQADWDNNQELYRYWAGSAGVSIENTPAVKVTL